jgi:FlgD Ig-like domain/Two component regulator propeller
MIFFKRIYILLAALSCCIAGAEAQDRPIGYWRSHLPYNSAIGIATDGNTIYTICNQGFFTLNATKGDAKPIPYSKAEGMSDIGMQYVAYDMTTSTAVLVYADGNIDLFKEKESTFYNIPDLKTKSVAGAKSVNNIYIENGIAYLSTSLGVLVIDLTSHNVLETYQFVVNNQIVPVNSFLGIGSNFYSITTKGIYKAAKNNPQLQNFQVWQIIDSVHLCNYSATVNGNIFVANGRSVYSLTGDTVHLLYTTPTIYDTTGLPIGAPIVEHIDGGFNKLYVSEYNGLTYNGKVKIMDLNYNFVDSFKVPRLPMQVVQLSDSSIWIADAATGLEKRFKDDDLGVYAPPGPSDPNSYDIYAHDKNVWVAHGAYNDIFFAQPNYNGISNFHDNDWTLYNRATYKPFENLDDFVAVLKDEQNGTLYAGSYLNGLFQLNPDGSNQLIDSKFDPSFAYGGNVHNILGLAFDNDRNLWVSLMFSEHQLYAKDPDNNWYKFFIPGKINGGPVTVDDNGQVWFIGSSGGGIVTYNTNGTLGDLTDDKYYHLTSGVGSGNLPSNKVYSIAKDNKNNIWVGTDNGIAIVSNCSAPFSNGCDAQIPVVQYDQFAGYLFAGNTVRTIAVDGANRKWVGTDDGVWLLSPNAEKIIYRFTKDNSPLPSNHVRKIAIDKVTGDVYIGTDQGLVSYHSTATDGGPSNSHVSIFPNPVVSGYAGTIAIKGLATNANVSITDMSGQLVYKTTAFGGQAVWDGKDYTGHRPQSGVYLVFVSSADGSQTYTGKIVFMQ